MEKQLIITLDNKKSPYEIITILVERIILPKYPFLTIKDVDSFSAVNRREYEVRFLIKKKIPAEIQVKIDEEVKDLFKMAGLDEIEKHRPNTIEVWFKTPKEKDYSFSSTSDYNRRNN